MYRIAVTVVVVLVLLVSVSEAQIPRTISYQGVLSDSLGIPKPDGNYLFTFSLYQSLSAAAQFGVNKNRCK